MNAANGVSQSGIKLRMDFSSSPIKWIKKFYSTSSNDIQTRSSWYYSSSDDYIYSLTSFSVSQRVVLFQMNASNGNSISINMLNAILTESSGIIFNNNSFYIVSSSSSQSYFIIFDLSTKATTSYSFQDTIKIYNLRMTSDLSK